ncbi:hypothetical protein VTJ04DRAFT_1973 [Mycothermus thermophilus]|uniref:uncharacterized protein n=1 Tax=Humicola insolens TaxID=85995 RepID=UPI0037425A42
MPPKLRAIDDPTISIRLRYGPHVIFILADITWTFQQLTTELLSILRNRYPDGLRQAPSALPRPPGLPDVEEKTPIPAADDANVRIAYALPRNASDLASGWKNLKARPEDTLGKKGVTDLSSVAFAFVGEGEDEANAEFHVVVPTPPEETASME